MAESDTIRVLLIEDSEIDALFVSRLLTSKVEGSFEVLHAAKLSDALELLRANDFDVALVDLCLPDAIGLEAFEQIRSLDARIPIVVFSGSDDDAIALQAIESGAQDFIAKGQVTGQLLFRVLKFAIARQRKVMGFQAAADTDPLTGMPNRRHLESQFAEMHASAQASGNPMCVALFDVDHFKRINDEHGHFIGDAVLKEIASVLARSLPDGLSAARFGGEEFALLMPEYGRPAAQELTEAVLTGLARHPMTFDGSPIRVTASAGLIEVRGHESWDEAFVACDEALYRAKAEGRNRLCQRIDPPSEDGKLKSVALKGTKGTSSPGESNEGES
ncbi:MAG: GGDEF domain-containing protein [Rubripirellula sp.]